MLQTFPFHSQRVTSGDGKSVQHGCNMATEIPLPIFFGDIWSSVRALMAFPDDMVAAKSYAAQMVSRVMPSFMTAGNDLTSTQRLELHEALDPRNPSKDEIEDRVRMGTDVGEILFYLWGLICSQPESATVETAIAMAVDYPRKGRTSGGRSKFRSSLSIMAPVLHLLGAWQLRDARLHAGCADGYDGLTDLGAFMTEAMALRQALEKWDSDGRHIAHQSRQSGYLARDFFGPWIGWQPHEHRPGWPLTGMIPALSIPADSIPAHNHHSLS